ncbi:MAG: energy transducer TonB [Nibricoccus sp.]
MNKVSKLAVIVGLTAFLGTSGLFASATEFERAYVKSFEGRTDIPVPVAVVSPQSVSGLTGQVNVEFVVSETGKPTRITVKSSTDEALVDSVLAAVVQWKFAPAKVNGVPVARTVVVPVRFQAADSLLASY